jgi:hypothetical protein
MAVVRPSNRPSDPPRSAAEAQPEPPPSDAETQPEPPPSAVEAQPEPPHGAAEAQPALVRVPFSRQQAPAVQEAAPPPLTPAQALKPLSPELAKPLSPELALVSPELAEEARAQLPERPWEKFTQLPEAKRLRVETTPPVRRPARAVPQRRPAPAPRRRRPRVPVSTFVLIGLTAFMAVTGVLPARDAPTLLPAPTKAKPAPERTTPAARARLVAGAVYAEGDRLRLRVDRGGRRLTGTTGALPCAARGVSFRARVARDGSFRGAVRAVRPGRGTGSVLGRFGPRTTASGVIRIRQAACDSGPVLFVAGTRRGG